MWRHPFSSSINEAKYFNNWSLDFYGKIFVRGNKMKKGIAYIIALIVISLILFYTITNWLKTSNPAIVFFLAMIVADKILDKNRWIVEAYEEGFGSKTDKNENDK
jgi:hypothetical protein